MAEREGFVRLRAKRFGGTSAVRNHPAVARLDRSRAKENGGEGGIRTHVPVTRQDAFEAPPLRPLRYLSGSDRRLQADTAGPAQAGHYLGPAQAGHYVRGALLKPDTTYCRRHRRGANISL